MPEEGEKKGLLKAAQALVALVRDGLLLVLFALLLLFPTGLNDILQKAGFTRGSFMGFEWEAQLDTATQNTEAAKQEAQKIEGKLGEYAARLEQVAQFATEPNVRNQARALATEIRGAQSTAQGVQLQLDRSLVLQRGIRTEMAAGVSGYKKRPVTESTPPVAPARRERPPR